MDLTPQEIQQRQGTRLSDKAPWETWDSEMDTKLSPEMQEMVSRYEERKHEKASNQALEILAQEQELSAATAEEYKWVRYEEYADIEPRIGRVMHSDVFLSKLRNCGFRGWYAEHTMKGRLKLIMERGFATDAPEYVCWIQEGFTTEFTVMKFDDHQVPLDERYRGWRTPLLQMQLKGILKEEDVLKEFGPATGPASKRYNSMLYEIRNKRIKAKEE